MSYQDNDNPISEPKAAWNIQDAWEDDGNTYPELDSLEKQVTNTLHQNKIKVLKHSGFIIVGFLWFLSAVFVVTFISWLWHFLTPLDWLTDAQLSKIQTLIFSSSLGAVASTIIQKYFISKN